MKFKTIKKPYIIEAIADIGYSNHLFIVNNEFFVKKTKAACHAFFDLENQLLVIETVKWYGFTLPILEASIQKNDLIIVMPYYQKLFPLLEIHMHDELIWELSVVLKKLHNIKTTNNIKTWDAHTQLVVYTSLIEAPVEHQAFLAAIKMQVTQWLKVYKPEKLVLCHNDLTLNNFVSHKGKWYLIDWDFACYNDPLFDVASFVSESLTRQENIDMWYYHFQITPQQKIIINHWIIYQNLIWYYWAYYMYSTSNDERYQIIANHKMKQLQINY